MFRVPHPGGLAALALFAAAATARCEEAPDVRLGHDVTPTFQSIRLHLDADKRNYSGSTHTELEVVKATNVVQLHFDGQALQRVSLRQGADTLHVEIARGTRGLLTLTAAGPLRPGPASLDIAFTNAYGTRAVGLYRVYTGGRGYLFTQFESDDARRAFPCWDEPGFKFPWQLTLEVPAAHEAICNTPVETQTVADGWKTIVFQRTPPLPSYLLAIATGPLEFTPVPGLRFPTRIVTVQGQSRLTARTAAVVPRLVTALERWFGTPYPYAKLDLVAVPEFAYGAMENAGAITFRDDVLLIDPATATVDQQGRNVSTTCHELAHMWFGDLVTMAWWDDLWLNESFADWMAAKITDETFPEYKDGLDDLGDIQRVMQGDALPSTMAIRSRTTASAAGLQNVGLVYSKGNAVLSTFENYLGPETFQKGVRAYLKAHAWGTATASDLWKALDEASGQNVSAAMATYTDQPGLPLLRVVPVEGGVRLTQSRCTPWGVSQPPIRWRIPIAMRWSDGRATHVERVLLTEESQVVKLPGKPAWIMPNAGGRGYFAWSAPGPMLESLAEHAQADLQPAERISFLGDLDLLLQAGEVHGDSYLRALAHFGSDPEPGVVASLLSSLRTVRVAFVPDSTRAVFAPYVRQALQPALGRYGFERKPGEDEAIGTIRGTLLETLARQGEDRAVDDFAGDAAKRYLADSSAVDPSVVDAVLGLAARHGDASMFAEYQRRFEAATVPQMRRRYLGALGGFDDPVLEERALDYTLTDAVRPTESLSILRSFGDKGEQAAGRMLKWTMAHYDRLATRIPPPALRFLPLMGSGCSQERLEAAKAFFGDPSRGVPGVEQSLERVSDTVHGCISLREREGVAVGNYLRSLGAK
jgi:alanyl aminopeptidase